MKKEVIFVGWVDKGNVPLVGETMKNQYIIAELQKYCKVIVLDFYQKKKHPWIYLQALWTFIAHPHASVILSTSAKNVYSTLKIFKKLGVKRNIIHWVVGGAFGHLLKEGRFDVEVFNYVNYNLVQLHDMISQLEECGVRNAKYVSNFKAIGYYPPLDDVLKKRRAEEKIRFVFLSRVHPAKGCDYILEAVETLNKMGLKERFIVDFYGKFEESYKKDFLEHVDKIENVSYKGKLNLREDAGYDTLATYHAMLFPTFHPSEGFAGIFIDAFIAALPVLASDWAYNKSIIRNGELGVIYPSHSVEALTKVMEDCIEGKMNLGQMAVNARGEASKYEAENVLNEDYIKELGLI